MKYFFNLGKYMNYSILIYHYPQSTLGVSQNLILYSYQISSFVCFCCILLMLCLSCNHYKRKKCCSCSLGNAIWT